MWGKWFSCLLVLLFSFCCLSLTSCDEEKIGDAATTISDTSERFAPLIPLPFRWIAYAVGGIASAVGGVAYGISEAKGKNAMRRGIQAIGKVIDHAKYSKKEEVRAAAALLLELFGSAKSLNNPGMRDNLLFADAVRKGLK